VAQSHLIVLVLLKFVRQAIIFFQAVIFFQADSFGGVVSKISALILEEP
jgi:hypothetical protein